MRGQKLKDYGSGYRSHKFVSYRLQRERERERDVRDGLYGEIQQRVTWMHHARLARSNLTQRR